MRMGKNDNTVEGLTSSEKAKIINLCKSIIPDAAIYVYGSRARGDFKPRSDIDLALQADTPISFFDIAELKDVLAATDMPYKFDVIDLNSIQDMDFKKQLLTEMVLWKK